MTEASRNSKRPSFIRFILPIATTVLMGLGTVFLWAVLKQHEIDQASTIAEAESYSSRSQVARSTESMLEALHSVREYWSNYGRLPPEQWKTDAGIELDHFKGIEVLLWLDPRKNIRYLRSDDHPTFDYRPTEEEWQQNRALADRLNGMTDSSIRGPLQRDDGTVYFEVYIKGDDSIESDGLAAVFDAEKTLHHILADESPGYAISVFWNDLIMYRRGVAAEDIPGEWIREGEVTTSLDTYWRVVHEPLEETAEKLLSPAIDLILLLGLVIAILMGTLIYENSRVKSRALRAEIAEKKLEWLNRELEQQVAARTSELNSRTVDLQTISDSVAHDLRNPLNAIAVTVELISYQYRDILPEDSQTLLARVTLNIRQAKEILDRMVDLSCLSHSTFERERVDMTALVRDVFNSLIVAEPPPPVNFHLEELPETHADRLMARLLVMNLVINAIKYTREKDDRNITVGYNEDGGEVVYHIKDNGVGFEKSTSEQIFEAFCRLGENQPVKGFGLGLTIAARAVHRHGGRIWANSTPGKGATFFFTLQPSIDSGHEHEEHKARNTNAVTDYEDAPA